jgi:hypothetical protein
MSPLLICVLHDESYIGSADTVAAWTARLEFGTSVVGPRQQVRT